MRPWWEQVIAGKPQICNSVDSAQGSQLSASQTWEPRGCWGCSSALDLNCIYHLLLQLLAHPNEGLTYGDNPEFFMSLMKR